MGTRRTWNVLDLIHFKNPKIRNPPIKAKQWIVICGEALRRWLLRDRAIEHPADDWTVEIRRGDTRADDAGDEDIHHDHDPVTIEQNRFARKEVDAPQTVLSVPKDGEPGRTITTWHRSVVPDKYASDSIFVDLDSESFRYLLGNLASRSGGFAASFR